MLSAVGYSAWLLSKRVFTVIAFCFGRRSCLLLELFGERDVVEEGPWVVELGIPCSFEVVHRLDHPINFLIPN